MTSPTPLVLTDALIEAMLIQRAGSGAPVDFVSDMVLDIGATPQRVSRNFLAHLPQDRARLLLVAAMLTVAGGAAVMIGSGLLQKQLTPSPAPSASGEPSPGPSRDPSPTPSVAPSESPPSDAFAAFPGLFGDVDPYQYRLVNETVGWVAMANMNGGTPAALYRTEDAGRTWMSIQLPEGGMFRGGRGGVALVDADTAVAAFGDGSTLRIVATHDRGASWTTATIDDPIVSTGSGPALWFRSPMIGTATSAPGLRHDRWWGDVERATRRDGPGRASPVQTRLGSPARRAGLSVGRLVSGARNLNGFDRRRRDLAPAVAPVVARSHH